PTEAFSIALGNLVGHVVSEQNFISDLFHYVPPAHTRAARRGPAGRKGSADDGEDDHGESEGPQAKLGENVTFYNWVTYKIRPIENWEVPRPKLDSADVVSQTVHFGSVKEVKSMLDLLFGNLATQVDTLVEMGTRFDPSQAVGMLVPISRALDMCKGSDQGFLINVLERSKDRLEAMFQRYVSEQARAIEATKFVTKKRGGALPFARVFPKFIAHIESLVGDTGYSARAIADSAYSRVSRLIFDTLETLLREADRNAQRNADDKDAQKEQLNAHVLLLENLFVLTAGLKAYKTRGCKPYFVPTLETYLDHANAIQRKVTRAYLKDVLQRPMGKLIGFFDTVDRCLAAKKDPLATSNLGKSQLKKVLQAHSSSNMRENIKQLSKRVDKHFINESRLQPVIWQTISDDMLSNYQRIVTLLARAHHLPANKRDNSLRFERSASTVSGLSSPFAYTFPFAVMNRSSRQGATVASIRKAIQQGLDRPESPAPSVSLSSRTANTAPDLFEQANVNFTEKKWLWVPHEKEGYIAGYVVSEDGNDMVTVHLMTGRDVAVNINVTERVNPPKFEKVEDMADLGYLNEASVMHNLKQRYASNMIYTYSGLFLVAVNPYYNLQIYGSDYVAAYKNKKRTEVPPHIFSIADAAFHDMLHSKENQSILITGESGAGKTENTKKVI
ncbi:class II myosin, partial [Coemansia sp. RSA 454]